MATTIENLICKKTRWSLKAFHVRTLKLYAVIFAILSTNVNGNFPNSVELFEAHETITCAVLVSRCMNRCDQRASEGITGIEYVQWEIDVMEKKTDCKVHATNGDEIVSANPRKYNNYIYLFKSNKRITRSRLNRFIFYC